MATKKVCKKDKNRESLDDLLQEATNLLDEKEKSRKRKKGESDFEFYRDSVTRLRALKHVYNPRQKKPTKYSSASTSSVEGELRPFYL